MNSKNRDSSSFKATKFAYKASHATSNYTVIGLFIGICLLVLLSGNGNNEMACFYLLGPLCIGLYYGARKKKRLKIQADLYRTVSSLEQDIRHLHQKLESVPVAQPLPSAMIEEIDWDQSPGAGEPNEAEAEGEVFSEGYENETMEGIEEIEASYPGEQLPDIETEDEEGLSLANEEISTGEHEDAWTEEDYRSAAEIPELDRTVRTTFPPEASENLESKMEVPMESEQGSKEIHETPMPKDFGSNSEPRPQSTSHKNDLPESQSGTLTQPPQEIASQPRPAHPPGPQTDPEVQPPSPPSLKDGFPRWIICPYCHKSLEIPSIGNFVCTHCNRIGRVDEHGNAEQE
jgi:hypothetical protein